MKKMHESDVKMLREQLERAFGVMLRTDDYVFIETGEDKIRITTQETYSLASTLKGVVNVGLYVIKRRKHFPTLTIEGCMFIETSPLSHTVELSKEDAISWMRGDPVNVGKTSSKTVVGIYKGHFLGSALVDVNGIAYPQVPKWRRIPASIN
ncbi:MAG: hypothetical protein RMI49_00045 [Candidatus Caldarchaeum sp.]|nr:hypothetical protein [Candidatus Caldarchaeum sp.]